MDVERKGYKLIFKYLYFVSEIDVSRRQVFTLSRVSFLLTSGGESVVQIGDYQKSVILDIGSENVKVTFWSAEENTKSLKFTITRDDLKKVIPVFNSLVDEEIGKSRYEDIIDVRLSRKICHRCKIELET